jgi:hypothetical protein
VGDVGCWDWVLSGALPATIVTSLVRRIARTAFLVPCLLIGISCARFPAELAPDGADKAVLAIKVNEGGFSGWLRSLNLAGIIFVRLQADGQNRQGKLLASNHLVNGYAYLFNASPGRYAAIGFGASGTFATKLGGGIRFPYNSMMIWFFPESMVDETTITVEPSGVAFMGEFEVSGNLQFDDADDTQIHYANFLIEDADQARFKRWWEWGPSFRFVAEYQKAPSEMATERFVKSSRGLAELGWRAWITRASAEDGDNEGVSEQPDK